MLAEMDAFQQGQHAIFIRQASGSEGNTEEIIESEGIELQVLATQHGLNSVHV